MPLNWNPEDFENTGELDGEQKQEILQSLAILTTFQPKHEAIDVYHEVYHHSQTVVIICCCVIVIIVLIVLCKVRRAARRSNAIELNVLPAAPPPAPVHIPLPNDVQA